MKKKILFLVIAGMMFVFGLGTKVDSDGCSGEKGQAIYDFEQQHTVDNQTRLNAVQPPVSLNWSLEREQVNRRTKLWNDPNKVSYIYLINYGKVMAFYVIKGKVSSVNSQVTNTQQIIWSRSHGSDSHVLPSPAEDGSYGSNGEAVFFFTTEGAYVEWLGDYMLSDYPLKLSQQPEMIRQIK